MFYLGVVLSLYGLQKQSIGTATLGMCLQISTIFGMIACQFLVNLGVMERTYRGNVNLIVLLLSGPAAITVSVVMVVNTVRSVKNFGLGIIDFAELEGITKKEFESVKSTEQSNLSVLMKV